MVRVGTAPVIWSRRPGDLVVSLKAYLGELNVITPKRHKLGRVAAIVDAVWAQYLRLIVPRNGRWWDDRRSDDNGSDLVWVESGDWSGGTPRFRIGDWVRVQGQSVTLEEPILVEPVLDIGADGEGPRLRVPAVPWADEWLREAQDGLCLFDDRLPWFPESSGTRTAICGCSCGEHGCGHLEVRIDHDPLGCRVIWSELMANDSRHLGPALSFDESAYRSARPR